MPFGKREGFPGALGSQPEESQPVERTDTELEIFFNSLSPELQDKINDHATAANAGESQDSKQRKDLEVQAVEEGIDADMVGKLIGLQQKRVNNE